MTVRFAARGITVRYGANTVLDDVALELQAGLVRVLLGANGAGKSTLLSVIAGALKPASGQMSLDGKSFEPHSTRSARRHGVVIVPQEPALVPELSVEANVMLGIERARLGFVRRDEHDSIARTALMRLGHADIDLSLRGASLSLGDRHIVAIARAMVLEPRVVVLDEPTASLSISDAERVIACVRELALQGVAVLYVTHFLDEVARVGDTFTILSKGRVTGTGDARNASIDHWIEHIFGDSKQTPTTRVERELGDVVLSVNGLRGREAPRDVDLFVRRGEIVGLFGLTGSGRSAFLRTILGADERIAGTVRVEGSPPLSPGVSAGLRAGIALLAEDRSWNIFDGLSVVDQVVMARPLTRLFGFFSSPKRELLAARAALATVRAGAVDPRRSIDELSGGTQQKTALARLVHRAPNVLLLDEPMRGLDVASTHEIERWLIEFASEGRCVLVAGSDEDELLCVCDSIAVMRRGRIVDMRSVSHWTRADLLRAAAGTGDAA